MLGDKDARGIAPLVLSDLFAKIAAASSASKQFLVAVSYLEIYNEVVKDLLNPSNKQLKVREHPDIGIYVEGLAELVVKDEAAARQMLDQGNRVRRVAETDMNSRSSRSHSCFTLRIEQKTLVADNTAATAAAPGAPRGSANANASATPAAGATRETVLRAKLNLVDLAGSERPDKSGAAGQLMREGAAINKSLSALGNVINALSRQPAPGHVPYVRHASSQT
jgi:hypothetical protein